MKNYFEETRLEFNKMLEKFNCPSSKIWLDKIESELTTDGRELSRKIFQGHLNSRGEGYVGKSIETKTGEILSHKRLMKRNLYTLFGKVTLTRTGYSNRKHFSIFPLDAVMNLPPSTSFSYGLQKFIAKRTAKLPFSEVINIVKEFSGIEIGSRQILQIVEKCTEDFDRFYIDKNFDNKKNNHILVLTTDGKGIVMRSESLRDETKKRAASSENKMTKRLSKGEKSNRKRMAQVASIYFIDKFKREPKDIMSDLRRKRRNIKRPRPIQKRVWASVEKESEEVIKSMFDEALKRDPKNNIPWVVLVDGNRHQLSTIEILLNKHDIEATIILDIIHVIEYLWTASRSIIDEINHEECQLWVEERLLEILNGNASRVAGSIRMSSSKLRISKNRKTAAENCAQYISGHKNYMMYNEYLKNGFPIATGVIEGACRYLIKDRMDVTGARWSLDGAEAVLKLRSLLSSNDFESYWEFYLKNEYERNYNKVIKNLDRIELIR